MEIKNTGIFFIGIIVLILGLLIIIFDYPQIELFEKMDTESYYLMNEEKKDFHQRLIFEFSIGIVILALGILLLIISLLRRFEKEVR
ncbi:hypothetical protein [Nitrosopumilus ureiphilus]|uniref:Uncharacterized protein n=1 Tax=Nitrosopumilus ureiphilus TaxID=1470067 RepID=A0A7D5R2J3_9ARCH|nr:hypothetical protein [Nitrosopumilus ureiphilus]QLH07536.1 hypothetical protein C5F50_11000 [Nitrosopumilus ureiphilus]